MNPLVGVFILAATVLLDSTVVGQAGLGSATPFLTLLAVVSWGLQRGPMAALWWGLAAGALLDGLSPSAFGTYTVPMLAVAGVVAASRGRLFPTNVLLPPVVAAGATAAFALTQRAIVAATGADVSWAPMALVRDELLPQVTLNLLWLPVLFFPLRALARRTGPPRIEWER